MIKALHFRKKKSGQAALHLIVLDTSASTLSQQLLSLAKGAVLQITERAYLQREQVALIGFGNEQVEVLMKRQRSPKQIIERLDDIGAAGGTPIREAIVCAQKLQRQYVQQSPSVLLHTYVITDGRTTQTLDGLSLLGHVMVIDTEQAVVKRGRAPAIAQLLNAEYIQLEQTKH